MQRREFLAGLLALPFAQFALKFKKFLAPSTRLSRVAFGSCLEQDIPQPIWEVVHSYSPDLFLFLGDNIYADTENMTEMAGKYQLLSEHASYARFRSRTPIMATWDDHDMGINDGGREYPFKQESKKLMLDFFGEPTDSPRRFRDGVYTSAVYGEANQRVQVILLDLRWFRSPLVVAADGWTYIPNTDPEADFLGEQQWQWLEAQLRIPADVRILGSSVQMVSAEHPYEKWANFPHEKARLMSLLDRLEITNLVVVSGDMHFAEISVEETPAGTPIYDITASGLNKVEDSHAIMNSARISMYDRRAHFGLLNIEWKNNQKPHLFAEIIDDRGRRQLHQQIQF